MKKIALLLLGVNLAIFSLGQSSYHLFSSSQLTSPVSRGGMTDLSGNHLMVFVEQAGFPSDWDICLMKLSGNNNSVLWSKRYRIPATSEDIRSFAEDQDHYYIVGFSQLGTNSDGLVIKVKKSDGILLLAKKFNGAVSDDRDEFSGIFTENEKLVICGYTKNPSFASGVSNKGDGIILELSSLTLDTLRTRRIGAHDRFDNFTHIVKAGNGDILLAGTKAPFIIVNPSNPANDYLDLTLFRLDPTWNILWKKTYNNYALSTTEALATGSSGLVEKSSGNIYMTFDPGWSSLQRAVYKLSSSGNFLQGSSFPVGTRPLGLSVKNEELLVYGISGTKAQLSSITSAGLTSTWSKRYNIGTGTSIVWNTDTMPGKIFGFGSASSNTRLLFFQTNTYGSLGSCGTETLTLATTPYTPDTTRTFPHLVGYFPFQGVNLPVTEISLTMSVASCTDFLLPVELLTFEGESTDMKRVKLEWITATESNSLRFDVERSNDAFTFYKVGEVFASGNSQSMLSYDFIDEEVPTGEHYYRLRIVDANGYEDFSRVIVIKVFETNKNFLYPNPCSVNDMVLLEGKVKAVSLRTIVGDTLWRNDSGTIGFNAPHVVGTYLVGFQDGTNSILVVR